MKNLLKQFISLLKKNQLLILFLMIGLTLSATLIEAFNFKMNLSTQESLHVYMSKYTAVAISSLQHNLHGFLGYNNIFQILLKNGTLDDEVLQKAVTLTDYASGGIFQIVSIDIGYANFSKIAFFLFGFKVSSLLYFYFLVLFSSILAFTVEFRKNFVAMCSLALFTFAFYLVALKCSEMPYNVGIIYGYRFTSLLAVLPLLHLTFFTFSKDTSKTKPITHLPIAFQSTLIIWVHYIRLSAQWMIISVLALLLVNLFHSGFFTKKNFKNKFKQFLRLCTPVFIFFSIFILSKIILFYSADKVYREQGSGAHVFWHSLYVGLALHPEIRAIYNDETNPDFALTQPWTQIAKYRPNDQDAYSAAFKWLEKKGLNEYEVFTFKESDLVEYRSIFTYLKTKIPTNPPVYNRKIDMETDYHWGNHERLLREVVLDILKNHTKDVLETILIIKPLKFSQIYLSDYLKAGRLRHPKELLNFKTGILLVALIILSFLIYWSGNSLTSIFFPVSFTFIFSLVIPIAVYPEPWTIADQALLLNLLLYTGFISLFIFAISYFRIEEKLTSYQKK